MTIVTNKRTISKDTYDIPRTNRSGYGVKGWLNLRKGEYVINVFASGQEEQ